MRYASVLGVADWLAAQLIAAEREGFVSTKHTPSAEELKNASAIVDAMCEAGYTEAAARDSSAVAPLHFSSPN